MAPGIADKKNNNLPYWGNEKTMNLNSLILTNIQSSHYFKVNLYQLKTYHEVIDEIYYQVNHLEPWEKGSRKTAGQTGMCGGVRGVGAGGIVSTAFCILYKLFTLKLTRKQVVGLINHTDSSYIRALGFMYIRYTQPPADLWPWYEPYLEDEEEVDVKAGGGQMMTVGEMLRHFLSKLEWFSTLFPRIPVPIQKDLELKLTEWRAKNNCYDKKVAEPAAQSIEAPPENRWDGRAADNPKEPRRREKSPEGSRDRDRRHHRTPEERNRPHPRHRSRSRSPVDRKHPPKDEARKHRDRERFDHSRNKPHSSHHRDYDKSSRERKDSHPREKESHSHSRSRNRH